ncbi:MAG: putative rane protein [Massilia sp.]|jgi:predicted outer membrane protein
MQKNKALKGLLAVSAAAAMFSAFGVQAQTTTSTQSAADLQKQTDQGTANMTGKTARDGTVNNTNSQGMEDRSGQVGSSTAGQSASGTAGHSGHAGQSGSTAGSAGMSGSTGTGATGMSGQSGAAGATAAGTAKLSKADSKGIMDMAMVNMAEIEMGKLAQSKSQNPEVKTFAQQMIDDHTKGLAEVQGLAQSKGITLPTELDTKHKARATRLSKLSGEKFDREYMKVGGVAAHKEAHALLQKNQKAAKDPDVQALVTKMMPVVEQHLKSAQQMPAGSTSSGK